ncbi:MAG: LPS assembly lipoprotein LptE [Gammaproteobacteria bacterium]|nr:LPS assembly lipoprotein LptE [Gammaproteobacteria bacterium]
MKNLRAKKNPLRNPLRLISVSVILLLMLSACGFHLRGAYQLPAEMSSVYLSAKNSHSELLLDLRRTLQANGSLVIDDATRAKASLKIQSEKQTERVISVDSHGRASEYELKFDVIYSLSVVDETEKTLFRINDRKLELIREYLYDSTAVLGTASEKSVLIRDMQRDASRLIMLQIQAAYRKANEPAGDDNIIHSAPVLKP